MQISVGAFSGASPCSMLMAPGPVSLALRGPQNGFTLSTKKFQVRGPAFSHQPAALRQVWVRRTGSARCSRGGDRVGPRIWREGQEGFGLKESGNPIDSIVLETGPVVERKAKVAANDETRRAVEAEERAASGVGGKQLHAVVVGAGPAGSLMALLLAKQGVRVDVFDRRVAPTRGAQTAATDWNTVLSARGIWALEQSGEDVALRVLASGVRLESSLLVGDKAARSESLDSDLVSISVGDLVNRLTEIGQERYPDLITYHSSWTLESADLSRTEIMFTRRTGQVGRGAGVDTLRITTDVLIGADGADSKVRRLLEKQAAGFHAEMQCSDAGRVVRIHPPPTHVSSTSRPEFHPKKRAQPARLLLGSSGRIVVHRSPRCLHVLPGRRGEFSLRFEHMKRNSAHRVAQEVEENWPEIASLFPEDGTAAHDLAQARELQSCLLSCSQYNSKNVVLIGDAAHALRSELELGTNFALEDSVLLATQMAEAFQVARATEGVARKVAVAVAAFAAFSAARKPEMDIAAKLCQEMVTADRRWESFKYAVMQLLHRFVPSLRPWQASLTFTRDSLATIYQWREDEDRGVGILTGASGLVAGAVLLVVLRKLAHVAVAALRAYLA